MRPGLRSHQTRALAVMAFAAVLCGCPDKTTRIVDPVPTPPVTPRVLSVSVSPTNASVAQGSQTTLSASVAVEGTAASTVTWSVGDGTVVSVAGSGSSVTVTGLKVGQTTVTATSTFDVTMKSAATVSVTAAPIASIVLSSATNSFPAGSTLQVQALVKDALGNTVASPTLNWTSSVTANATVSGTGLVTGVKAGTTNITATSGSVTSNVLPLTILPTTTVLSWAPQVALPAGYLSVLGNVRGLWSPGTNPVYAVTTNGEIGSWNGSAWTLVDQTTNFYNGVGGTSTQDVYAVGVNGTTGVVRMFNGVAWSSMTLPASVPGLNAVWASATGRAFAVGNGGTIIRLQGGVWTTMVSGATEVLRGVWGSSETNVFAVGDGGVVLRFNGTTWTRSNVGTQQLNGVWGRGAAYAVAVGNQGFIATWNGTVWTTAVAASVNLSALLAVAGDSIQGTTVASGASGTVLIGTVLNPGVWASASQPVTNATNTAAWRNDNLGILVGWEIGGVSRRSTIGSWSVLTITPGWNGVAAVDANVAHAVGDGGSVATLANGTWQVTPAGVGGNFVFHLQAWAASATAVYAVRGTGVWRFDGGSWTPQYEPTSQGFAWQAIGGTSTSNVFAAGAGGGQFGQFNGAAWSTGSPNPLAATEGLRNFGSTPTLVLGVGITSTILRWRAGVWDRMAVPTTAILTGVSIADDQNAFAVGTGGTILKYNGTSWTLMNSGVTTQLNGVWSPSATEAYAVGLGGLILKFNGTSWTPMTSGTTRDLRAISGISGQYAVAVGAGATIVMGRPTASAALSVRGLPIPAAAASVRSAPGSLAAPSGSASILPKP